LQKNLISACGRAFNNSMPCTRFKGSGGQEKKALVLGLNSAGQKKKKICGN
jgi:hypothetical protein